MASIWRTKHSVALMAAGCGAAVPFFAPVVMASEDKSSSSGHVKPSQLPIYDDPEDLFDISYEVSGKGQLQEGVEVVRKELCGAVGATKEFRDEVTRIYETGKAHTAGQIAYLREDENVVARSGAIAVGGVLGLMLGARGRFFKKLLYTSAGAAGTAAVLYPQYSKQYTQDALDAANSYSTVAYNFLVGVKPQTTNEESESASSAGAAAAAKAGGKVEVSNPYPSLLTLPHSRLFTKKPEKNYWPYVRAVKPGPVITQDKSLEQMAEEASQVSTLGFRLQERETDPTKDFGSVRSEFEMDEEKNPVSSHEKGSDVISLATKREENSDVEPRIQEHAASSSEANEKASDEKFINRLIDATEEVIEIASEVKKDAKLAEEISEQVEKVSEVIPVIGEKIESAAEFVKEAATVIEEIADAAKEVAEKIEVIETAEAKRESPSFSKFSADTGRSENQEKPSIFKKVSNFFSSSDDTKSVSSNVNPSSSAILDSSSSTELTSYREAVEKQEKSVPERTSKSNAVEPIEESGAALRNDSVSSTSEAEKAIPELSEESIDSHISQKHDLGASEKNETALEKSEVSQGQLTQPSFVKDDSDANSNLTETSQIILEATRPQGSGAPASSKTTNEVESTERPTLFSKIANFFGSDSSSTDGSSPKPDLNNNVAEKVEVSASSASNSGTNLLQSETSSSNAPDVNVVQKPEIPDSLLKAKVTSTPQPAVETSLPRDESQPATKDDSKSQVSDSVKQSLPDRATEPSETSKLSQTPKPSETSPSDSLVKAAPPNPNVKDSESDAKPKEREMSRVRDEGGLMIIESPGSEDVFAVFKEASKNEPKESPSEAKKTSGEDHGQSNPSDADMYTTRS